MFDCQFCGGTLDIVDSNGFRIKRSDASFCSVACHDNYHNGRRRIERLSKRAALAIVDLRAIDNPTLAAMARDELERLLKLLAEHP